MIRFAGYAAVFDRIDRGGDIIRPAAFAASLTMKRPWPLFLEHRIAAPIGLVESAESDRRGLRVIARLLSAGASPDVARATAMLGQPRQAGLSFGYRVLEARGQYPRQLIALDLIEISLVAMPMQPLARVHAVQRMTN